MPCLPRVIVGGGDDQEIPQSVGLMAVQVSHTILHESLDSGWRGKFPNLSEPNTEALAAQPSASEGLL